MEEMSKRLFWFLLPLFFVLCIAPFTPEIDLWAARRCFTPGEGGGSFIENGFTRLFFHCGEHVGLAVGAAATGIYLISWLFKRLKPLRKGALTMVLTLLIGPGLITNSLLKEYWSRPRPKQVIEFGGNAPFRPFYAPHFSHNGEARKSFPSGHATMGFYYLSLALPAYRSRRRWLFLGATALTLFMGLSLSVARVIQGAHFVSDTLFAFVVVWMVAWGVDALLHFPLKKAAESPKI